MKSGDSGRMPAASVQRIGYILAVGPLQDSNTNWRISCADLLHNCSDKKGRIHRQVFTKLRTTKSQKKAATADSFSVEFARVLQCSEWKKYYGLCDRVSRKEPEVLYTQRQLLGVKKSLSF